VPGVGSGKSCGRLSLAVHSTCVGAGSALLLPSLDLQMQAVGTGALWLACAAFAWGASFTLAPAPIESLSVVQVGALVVWPAAVLRLANEACSCAGGLCRVSQASSGLAGAG